LPPLENFLPTPLLADNLKFKILVIGAIAYWAIGFAFAYGEPGNEFIGSNHFFSTNVKESNLTYVSKHTG